MGKSLIQQDSYWFLDGEGDEAKLVALCSICGVKQKKGWFWEGRQGYGDYDLLCSSCKNAIHIREKNEADNQG